MFHCCIALKQLAQAQPETAKCILFPFEKFISFFCYTYPVHSITFIISFYFIYLNLVVSIVEIANICTRSYIYHTHKHTHYILTIFNLLPNVKRCVRSNASGRRSQKTLFAYPRIDIKLPKIAQSTKKFALSKRKNHCPDCRTTTAYRVYHDGEGRRQRDVLILSEKKPQPPQPHTYKHHQHAIKITVPKTTTTQAMSTTAATTTTKMAID